MWSRALAGVFPGFLLAAGIVGLASWSWPGPWTATIVPALVAFFPVWIAIMASSFAFRNGRRAWLWLGTTSLASLLLLRVLQVMEWVR